MSDAAGPLPPYFVHRDFLAPDERAGLLEWVLGAESLFEPSKVMTRDGLRVDTARRNARSLIWGPAADPWKALVTDRLRKLMPDLCVRAGMKPFEVSQIQLDLTAYEDGAHVASHRDTSSQLDPAGDKVMSAVYYFFAEPKGFEGGALRLHRLATDGKAARDHVEIAPEQNSLVVFPSFVNHEVTPVRSTVEGFRAARFAINCWFLRERK
jgi:SM-20-related protein